MERDESKPKLISVECTSKPEVQRTLTSAFKRAQEENLQDFAEWSPSEVLDKDFISLIEDIDSDLDPPDEDANPPSLRTILTLFDCCNSFLRISKSPLDTALVSQVRDAVRYNAVVKGWYCTSILSKFWITAEECRAVFAAYWIPSTITKRSLSVVETMSMHAVSLLLRDSGIRALSWLGTDDRSEKTPGSYARWFHLTFGFIGYEHNEPQFIVFGKVPASKHMGKAADAKFMPFAFGARGASSVAVEGLRMGEGSLIHEVRVVFRCCGESGRPSSPAGRNAPGRPSLARGSNFWLLPHRE